MAASQQSGKVHNRVSGSRFRLVSTQLAEAIEERIRTGHWRSVLPGEIELASTFNVSRPTVRTALRHLEESGLIGPGCPGKCRVVLGGGTRAEKSGGGPVRIILPKPAGELPASYQDSITDISRRLRAAGHPVEVEAHRSLWNTEKPWRRMLPVFKADTSCFLLVDPTPGIESWLERHGMPCVCLGGTYNHRLPRVGSEGNEAVVLAAAELLACGHRRIVYPVRDQYGVQMAEVFHRELMRHGLEWALAQCAPCWRGEAPNAVALYERLFAEPEPPTAFITLGILNLLPLITWLGHRGLRVPDDVSIIHLLGDPLLASIHPPLTRYTASPQAVRRAVTAMVIKVAAAGRSFDAEKMIPMRRHAGRSVAPARISRRAQPFPIVV